MASKTLRTPLGRTIRPAPSRPAKRLLDSLVALVLLILLSPLMFLIAILIKLTSRGPVFYRDERLGRGGRVFRMFKFRTMKVNAPPRLTADGKLVVTRNAPRLTTIGRPLRALHLDEVPQLLNVLAGQMSFVGPRAGQPKYESTYSDTAYERLRVHPGITGLAAVLGGRHLTNECLYELEARYVRRQDLWLDFLIFMMTPTYVLFGPKVPRAILRRCTEGIKFHSVAEGDDET
ncbi:MAG: sugar transferase [Phycisphaerae bacterium]